MIKFSFRHIFVPNPRSKIDTYKLCSCEQGYCLFRRRDYKLLGLLKALDSKCYVVLLHSVECNQKSMLIISINHWSCPLMPSIP